MTQAAADKLCAALQNYQDLLEIICNDCLVRFKEIKLESHGGQNPTAAHGATRHAPGKDCERYDFK